MFLAECFAHAGMIYISLIKLIIKIYLFFLLWLSYEKKFKGTSVK